VRADRRAFSRGRPSNRSKRHGPAPVAPTAGFAVCGSSLARVARRHGMTPGMEEMRTAKSAVRATWCAEHVRQLGGESPLPNLMEVKG
jgi:hypothetical protein